MNGVCNNILKLATLIIHLCLPEFCVGVHHKWTPVCNGFVKKGDTGQQQYITAVTVRHKVDGIALAHREQHHLFTVDGGFDIVLICDFYFTFANQ